MAEPQATIDVFLPRLGIQPLLNNRRDQQPHRICRGATLVDGQGPVKKSQGKSSAPRKGAGQQATDWDGLGDTKPRICLFCRGLDSAYSKLNMMLMLRGRPEQTTRCLIWRINRAARPRWTIGWPDHTSPASEGSGSAGNCATTWTKAPRSRLSRDRQSVTSIPLRNAMTSRKQPRPRRPRGEPGAPCSGAQS